MAAISGPIQWASPTLTEADPRQARDEVIASDLAPDGARSDPRRRQPPRRGGVRLEQPCPPHLDRPVGDARDDRPGAGAGRIAGQLPRRRPGRPGRGAARRGGLGPGQRAFLPSPARYARLPPGGDVAGRAGGPLPGGSAGQPVVPARALSAAAARAVGRRPANPRRIRRHGDEDRRGGQAQHLRRPARRRARAAGRRHRQRDRRARLRPRLRPVGGQRHALRPHLRLRQAALRQPGGRMVEPGAAAPGLLPRGGHRLQGGAVPACAPIPSTASTCGARSPPSPCAPATTTGPGGSPAGACTTSRTWPSPTTPACCRGWACRGCSGSTPSTWSACTDRSRTRSSS